MTAGREHLTGSHRQRVRVTRVIFVDGLPGSGKSTTAEWIAVDLAARGLPCRLLREREADHPLNVGGDLHPSGSTTGTRMFSTYTVSSFVEESLARWREGAFTFIEEEILIPEDATASVPRV